MSKKFDTAISLLDKLGVKYGTKTEYRDEPPHRKPHDLSTLTSITFPFSAEEWCSVACNAGDEYIGGCCSQCSYAQDLICHIFRFDPVYTPIASIEELANVIEGHDGIREFPEVSFDGIDISIEEAVERISSGEVDLSEMTVLSRMALVWHIVKGVYDRKIATPDVRERTDPLDSAIWTTGRALQSISIGSMFESSDPDYQGPIKPESQTAAIKILRMYKLLPGLKILNEKIDELYPGPMNGFAIWSNETDTIAHNGNGPCVFYTKQECEDLLTQWESNEAELEEETPKDIRKLLSIRQVSISKEKGIESEVISD